MIPRTLRRLVTGHDSTGKAVVVSDGQPDDLLIMAERGVAFTEMWRFSSVPTALDAWGERDPGVQLSIAPAPGGVNFRVVQFDPRSPEAVVDGEAAFAKMGSPDAYVPNARHPAMHRTSTVDFAIVISGSITLLLDDQDVTLAPGDVVVQRGTNHAWVNHASEPCLIAFVLTDAS
jgi:mannose-6-phosphate isomerase-like protein (cupin superfamily)